jgi:LytS/YehU family sensor histidine kinase
LDFLKKYLEIQELRFQEQLFVEMTIDPDALTASVPYFLLQPLVENAIKHGISKRTGPGRIDIDVHRRDEWLDIKVTNDVPPLDSNAINVKDGLGLGNIKVRLRSLYGDMQHLEIKSLPGHRVEVGIAIPFRVSQSRQNGADSIGELLDDVQPSTPAPA